MAASDVNVSNINGVTKIISDDKIYYHGNNFVIILTFAPTDVAKVLNFITFQSPDTSALLSKINYIKDSVNDYTIDYSALSFFDKKGTTTAVELVEFWINEGLLKPQTPTELIEMNLNQHNNILIQNNIIVLLNDIKELLKAIAE